MEPKNNSDNAEKNALVLVNLTKKCVRITNMAAILGGIGPKWPAPYLKKKTRHLFLKFWNWPWFGNLFWGQLQGPLGMGADVMRRLIVDRSQITPITNKLIHSVIVDSQWGECMCTNENRGNGNQQRPIYYISSLGYSFLQAQSITFYRLTRLYSSEGSLGYSHL